MSTTRFTLPPLADPTADTLRQALTALGVPADVLPAETDAAAATVCHALLVALAHHLTGHIVTSPALWDLHHSVRAMAATELEDHCTPAHAPNPFREAPPRIPA